MIREPIIIRGDGQRDLLARIARELPLETVVSFREANRTLEQNALLWPLLTDLSRQVEWQVNGTAQKLTPNDWKDLATASLQQEQRVAQGMNGGFVFLGRRTSTMSKRRFSDLLEVVYAFGARNDVEWSTPDARERI